MSGNNARINEIKAWLDAAIQQVAAESYWHLAQTGATVQQILQRGNSPVNPNDPTDQGDQYVRLTSSQANEFAQRYEVRGHHANDSSGFSATLLFDKQNQKYTLAFRSTEYKFSNLGGDKERDVFGADIGIYFKGFALAQISAMEKYVEQLRAPGGQFRKL